MEKGYDERLEQLEVDLAHANRTIEDLNSVVVEQGKQIDRLTRLFSEMTDHVGEIMENLPGHQVDKPPHY